MRDEDDDFMLLRGFVTDWRTDERTFVTVESLSRLKNSTISTQILKFKFKDPSCMVLKLMSIELDTKALHCHVQLKIVCKVWLSC